MTRGPHRSNRQSRKELVGWRSGSHPFPKELPFACPYLHRPCAPGSGPAPRVWVWGLDGAQLSPPLRAVRLPAIAPRWRGSRAGRSRVLCAGAPRVNKQLSLEDSADTLRGSYRAQAAKTSRRIPGESSAASIWLQPYLAGSGPRRRLLGRRLFKRGRRVGCAAAWRLGRGRVMLASQRR